MKQFILTGLFLMPAFLCKSFAQIPRTNQASWQQSVDHNIRAELDVASKILRCEETITYTNNSPDIIREIPMHIWPNAFSSKGSPYGKEAAVNGNQKFLHAKREDMGYLDSLSFEINGQKTTFSYLETDIVMVQLPDALQPGAKVVIKTPFRVKLPFMFSRMGYSDGLFAVTQWYPKPAVYDVNGWNTFSYVEQGEYYSEFGTYTVAITVPQHFIVGATGKLQEESEAEWLSELADGTAVKRSGDKTKTIHYVQENVSDFAWFADAEFTVGEGKVKLTNGHEVQTFALLHPKSKASKTGVLEAIETALNYYGKRVGNYPYDYCTAVIGELKAAGGMEYPMITICGSGDKGTVIHEVGHNWFQGMLGNQERRYPWMDESINTFYQLYAEGKAPKEWMTGQRVGASEPSGVFRIAHDLGVFQEGNLHSEAYQQTNYGAIVYMANPLRFAYLQEYLGKAIMDSCMRQYFVLWQYKHPLPDDMQHVFETVSGKDLNWFFNGLLGGSAPDVAIKKVKSTASGTSVTVNNKGNYSLPVKLEWKNGDEIDFTWIPARDTTVQVGVAQRVRLNPSGFLTESNIANNDARTRGILKTYGHTRIGLPDLYKRGINRIWVFPNVFSSNRYDGYMPGLVISNITFPRRNWEWWLLPSYGVQTKAVVGIAGLQRNIWFKKGPFTMAEIRAVGRSYHYRPDSSGELKAFLHLEPRMVFFLKRKRAWVQNFITADFVFNRTEKKGRQHDPGAPVVVNPDVQNQIFRIGWVRDIYKKARPGQISLFVESGKNYRDPSYLDLSRSEFQFTKAIFDAKYFVPYSFFKQKHSGFRIHGFATGYLQQKNRSHTMGAYDPVVSGANGTNDYAFRQLMVARSENMHTGGFWGSQLLSGGTGVRMLPNITASKFAAGINAETSFLPMTSLPFNLFFDAALAGNSGSSDLYWAGGVNYSLHIGTTTTIEINLPLVYSSNFNAAMKGLNWYETANFTINLTLLEPYKLARYIYQ